MEALSREWACLALPVYRTEYRQPGRLWFAGESCDLVPQSSRNRVHFRYLAASLSMGARPRCIACIMAMIW